MTTSGWVIDFRNQTVVLDDTLEEAYEGGYVSSKIEDPILGSGAWIEAGDIFETEQDALEYYLGIVIKEYNHMFLLRQKLLDRLCTMIGQDDVKVG